MQTKGFFQFRFIIINIVLVISFRLIWIPMLWGLGHLVIFYFFQRFIRVESDVYRHEILFIKVYLAADVRPRSSSNSVEIWYPRSICKWAVTIAPRKNVLYSTSYLSSMSAFKYFFIYAAAKWTLFSINEEFKFRCNIISYHSDEMLCVHWSH